VYPGVPAYQVKIASWLENIYNAGEWISIRTLGFKIGRPAFTANPKSANFKSISLSLLVNSMFSGFMSLQ
jgi:hypothetical protein